MVCALMCDLEAHEHNARITNVSHTTFNGDHYLYSIDEKGDSIISRNSSSDHTIRLAPHTEHRGLPGINAISASSTAPLKVNLCEILKLLLIY